MFAGRRLDLDDALLDLGHFELEERLHEERIGPAEDQSRALGGFLDALEDGADRLTLMKMLAMILLAIRNDCFRLAKLIEHDDELAALDLLDFAGEQLTHFGRELVADLGALAFADALDDPLLGGLHGGAAKHREIDRLFEHVTDLEARVEQAGILGGNLAGAVLDDVDDRAEQHDLDVALAFVDVDLSLYGRAVLLRQRGENAVLEQTVQLRALQLLGVRQLAKRSENFSGTRHRGTS